MPRPATARTAPDAPPPQAPHTATRRPRIVVTGSNELRVVRVARSLERLRARVDQMRWGQALDALAGDVAALVVVDPLRRLSTAAAVKEVRGHPGGGELPTYVVVDDDTPSKRVLGLFSAGASAVFEWPREAAVMSALFAESFGMARVRGRSTKPDQALGRTIRAHLRLYPELPARVQLFVRDGLVSVAGQVASLRRRQELIDTIAAIPGVRGVSADSLWVAAAGISDRQLRRRLSTLLEATLDDASALSLSVTGGHVRLTGTVRDQAEVRLLERLIASVKGVRELALAVEIADQPPVGDHRVAGRLRRALAVLFPREAIDVAVVDGAAILSGTVSSLLTKASIERFAGRTEGVRRVVCKIGVS